MTNPVIRLEFKKFGGLKYISHLDLQRALLRFIKRARIPVRYTEGFNPHPKIVFALTLSVGCESVCELVDVYIERDEENPEVIKITPEEFSSSLKAVLPNGLELVRAYYPEKSFSLIFSADYEITVFKKSKEDMAESFKETFSRPVEVLKKTKSGEKLIDISPLVLGISCCDDGDKLHVQARLSASQTEYLNPDIFIKGFLNTSHGENVDSWQVVRTAINFKEN